MGFPPDRFGEWRMRFLVGLTVVLGLVSVTLADAPRPLPDGQFVTVKDGHLHYNGARLRLWGTNFVCNVKRQGKDLELCFDRMAETGFNGVRLNLFEQTFLSGDNKKNSFTVPATVKGSGSPMDLLDHSIYLAKQRGMFFWISFTKHTYVAGDYDVMPDDGTREKWVKALPNSYFMVFFDDRTERVYHEFAKAILEHVNPYTGKRYADEETIGLYEMSNENSFVENILSQKIDGYAGELLAAKWNAWLKARYGSDEAILKAWGKLNDGESLAKGNIAFQPILDGTVVYRTAGVQKEFEAKDKNVLTRYPYPRGEDVVRFVCELYQNHVDRFMKFVRPLGKGISKVPIAATGRFGLHIPTYYAAAAGDFVSMGVYGFAMRPWSIKKTDPFYPYEVRLTQHPMFEQPVDLFRAKGKPYLFYECNDTRPNPYRVEFPARIASYLIHQDGDGAFWFHWDSEGYLNNLTTDEGYTANRLPIPDTSYPNAGLVHANDEAFLAAVKAAGTLFKAGAITPAEKPIEVTIGKDILFNLAGGQIGGHEHQTDLEHILREKVWRYGIRVNYDPNGPSKLPTGKEPHGLINMGPDMQLFWNGTSGHFRVDAPSAKMFTGFLPPFLDFKDVRVTHIDRNWGTISLIAEDGLPLDQSTSILVTAMSNGQNTGFTITPENLTTTDYFQQGAAQICGIPGTTPIVVDRVSATIQAKWLKGMKYQKVNFFRKVFDQSTISAEMFDLRGYEPTFYIRLTRPKPKAIKKLVVTGNSITWHPPLANSDWNNNWGMAATSQDKDFAHRLHKHVSDHQASTTVKPELIVKNFWEPRVTEPKWHEELAALKPDLIVIQIGDNLPDDKQNEENLGKPYEQLIRTIKKANPDALVVCASTWGCSKNKDPLMQAAAARAGALWVRIDIFIGDPKNRALNFKHAGVAWHPGDQGMQNIADALWAAIKPKLEE